MARVSAIILGVLLLGGVGCAAIPHAASGGDWVARHGGVVAGSDRERVVRIATAILERAGVGPVRVELLETERVGAFAWKDGRVFVTAGLARLCTNDEIAAAVAHEVGHLLIDGHVKRTRALSGNPGETDVENAADRVGCEILASSGISRTALVGLLNKLESSAGQPPDVRSRLVERIAALQYE